MHIISNAYSYCIDKLRLSKLPSILNSEINPDSKDYMQIEAFTYLSFNKIIIDVIGNSKSGKSTL